MEELSGFQGLSKALAQAESEGWPFRSARQQLAGLCPSSGPGSLLWWLWMLARSQLEVRAGSPAHALHLLRTLVTSHHQAAASTTRQPQQAWALRVWPAGSSLPSCLLQMGRAWEELGVASKARHYYDKAAHLAAAAGASAVEEESRGRARLVAVREGRHDHHQQQHSQGPEEEDAEEQQQQAALVLAEERRRAGQLQEAAEHYHRALASLRHEEEGRLPLQATKDEEEEGGGEGSCSSSSEARVEIWRALGEAMAGLGRPQEAVQLLQRAQAAQGGRATDRALARARLATWHDEDNKAEEEGGGSWRAGAMGMGRRTRCPALYRQLGRTPPTTTTNGQQGEDEPDVRAFLLAASVGTTFWNLPERGEEEPQLVVEGEEGWGLWEGPEHEEEEAWKARARQRMAGLRASLPQGWAVCVLAREAGEGGGLLMARVQQGLRQAVVRRVEGRAVGQVLGAWGEVMARNQRSMMRAEDGGGQVAANWGREQKVAWWAEVSRRRGGRGGRGGGGWGRKGRRSMGEK